MSFLTKEEIRESSPSIFADMPAEKMSSRYIFTPTHEVIDSFTSVGWFPTKVMAQKPSKRDPRFVKHSIRFAPESEIFEKNIVGQLRPEIMIVNSHNGSSPLFAQLGIFRMVCSNGLTISDTDFGKMKWRHQKIDYQNIKQIVCSAIEEFGHLYKKIDSYKQIQLTHQQGLQFAQKVIPMVWNGSMFEPEYLLKTHRQADQEQDLFTTFNVIQENITKGGIRYALPEENKNRRARTKAIKNIDKDLKVNMMLWAIMEGYSRTGKF